MSSFKEACTPLTPTAAAVSEGMFTTLDFKPPHVHPPSHHLRDTRGLTPISNILVLGVLKWCR